MGSRGRGTRKHGERMRSRVRGDGEDGRGWEKGEGMGRRERRVEGPGG